MKAKIKKKIRILLYSPNIDNPTSGSLVHINNIYRVLDNNPLLDITYLIHKKKSDAFWKNKKVIVSPRLPLFSSLKIMNLHFDVLHFSVVTIFAPLISKFRIKVATIHGGAIYENPKDYNFVKRLHNHLTRKFTLKKLDKVFTVSNYSRNLINQFDKVKLSNIEIVSNGISKNIIKIPNQLESKYFFHVSKFSVRKNPFYLLDCFREFNSKYPESLLKIAGSGWNNSSVNSYILNNKIKNIEILGRVTEHELSILYSNSMGHMFLSRSEGFGIPIIEALNCGCRTIFNDVGALKEIDNGFGFPTKNKNEVVKSMEELYINSNINFDQAAYKYCQKFDWDIVAQKYFESIKKIYEKN